MGVAEGIQLLRDGDYDHEADMIEAIMDKYIDAMRDLEMARADNKRLRAVLAEIAQEFRPGWVDIPTVAAAKAERALEVTP